MGSAVLGLLIAGLFLLSRHGGGLPSASSAPEKLVIAVPTAPHAALLHLAAAKGFFAAEGLQVEMLPVSHGKLALELLAQGKSDLAAAAELPFVVHVMNGRDWAIMASIASATTEMAVVARRDRDIGQARDLRGKRVGVTQGTSGEFFLWSFLIRNRLAPDSVDLVNAPPNQLDSALANGSLDAIAAWQPTRLRAATALGAGGVTLVEPNAYTATYVVVGSRSLLQARPQASERLLRALLKAEAYLKAEPQLALQLVAQRLQVGEETLEPSWRDQDFRVDLLQPQLITFEEQARWAMARGYAPHGGQPNFLPHLYLDALLAVRPERVTVVH